MCVCVCVCVCVCNVPMTLSIKTFSIAIKKCDTLHNGTVFFLSLIYAECRKQSICASAIMLRVIMLRVVMLSVILLGVLVDW